MRECMRRLEEEQIIKRAMTIVKYQNYTTKFALEKSGIKMPKSIFEAGVRYLKRGIQQTPLSKKLKVAIDNCVSNCVQPLTPAINERRKYKKSIYQNKEAKPPICNLPEVKKKLTSQFEYGVLVDDCIKLFNTEIEARAFLKGILFLNKVGNLVEVEKTIVK